MSRDDFTTATVDGAAAFEQAHGEPYDDPWIPSASDLAYDDYIADAEREEARRVAYFDALAAARAERAALLNGEAS